MAGWQDSTTRHSFRALDGNCQRTFLPFLHAVPQIAAAAATAVALCEPPSNKQQQLWLFVPPTPEIPQVTLHHPRKSGALLAGWLPSSHEFGEVLEQALAFLLNTPKAFLVLGWNYGSLC
jgi:hypothetical protein